MSTSDESADGGALGAVQGLETALSERNAARAASETKVAAAHAEAERLLAQARAAGTRAGRHRRDALLRDSVIQAAGIRADGDAAVEELRSRMADARDDLVSEFTALLLPEED